MSAHIAAIIALAKTTGIDVYDTDVPKEAPPARIIVSAPQPGAGPDASLDGTEDYVEALIQIKYVGATVEQARTVAAKAIPILHRSAPAVDGWTTGLRRIITGPFVTDRDLLIPTTGTHMVAAVDTYRYRATPT